MHTHSCLLFDQSVHSYVDSDPEEEEECAESHEEGRDDGERELLQQLPRELGGGDLVDEEPGGEEQPDGQQQHRQRRVDGRVHRGDVAEVTVKAQL